MKLSDLIQAFRVDTDDLRPKFLTLDEDAIRFANEAVKEAAVRGRLMFDDTQTVEVLAGVSRYTIPGSLFQITRAALFRQTDPGNPPTIPATYASKSCGTLTNKARASFDVECPYWREERKQPEVYFQEDRSLVLAAIVPSAYLLRLEGYRTPLDDELMDDGEDVPPINAMHHEKLVHWMSYRAYSKPDSEIFNPKKAQESLDAFESYFGLRPLVNQHARDEADRPHHNTAYW